MLSSRIASYVKHSAVALIGAAVLSTPAFVHAEGNPAVERVGQGKAKGGAGQKHARKQEAAEVE